MRSCSSSAQAASSLLSVSGNEFQIAFAAELAKRAINSLILLNDFAVCSGRLRFGVSFPGREAFFHLLKKGLLLGMFGFCSLKRFVCSRTVPH